MNYGELVTAIKDYCQNSETTFVNHINDFVIGSEDKVFMSVQMPSFWKSENIAVSDSASSYQLEAGVIDILSVRVNETDGSTGLVDKGPVLYLYRKDYDFLYEAYPGDSSALSTGVPKYYAVSSESVSSSNPRMTILIAPRPATGKSYAMTVDYYGKVDTDSITNGGDSKETWLSVTAPDVLLYGSLVQAYTFMKGEPDIIQMYEKQFMEGLALLKNLGEGRQTTDAYSQGQMRTPSA
jgi:hypothetical protein